MAQLKSAFTVNIWCVIIFSWSSSDEQDGSAYLTGCDSGRGHSQYAKLGSFRTTLTRLWSRANQASSSSNDGGESELHVEIKDKRRYGLLVLLWNTEEYAELFRLKYRGRGTLHIEQDFWCDND